MHFSSCSEALLVLTFTILCISGWWVPPITAVLSASFCPPDVVRPVITGVGGITDGERDRDSSKSRLLQPGGGGMSCLWGDGDWSGDLSVLLGGLSLGEKRCLDRPLPSLLETDPDFSEGLLTFLGHILRKVKLENKKSQQKTH